MEPIPGDTPEPCGNLVSNHYFIDANLAGHFMIHDICYLFTDNTIQSANFISMLHLNNVRGDCINFNFQSQGYQYCMSQYRLPPGHAIHAA